MHTTITRKMRSTESKCTIKNYKLLRFFLLLQYHWDKEFHFPGKFHFLVKTITDSDRLGLVYLNLAFSTANGVMFCEIYLQSAAHITTGPPFIYSFLFQVHFQVLKRSSIPNSSILDPQSSILDPRSWFSRKP